ncbi:hypothetical protein HPB47_015749 [Ixodes persulcatus]|uniref:Uncharacterized protein n=1 Tax=Ixodes persulcatus TaxID=34615 RepID=A0AC60QSQ5_IXOPE|nr:hypothetical protein HPB47_015749 [Ixodes persulcatus]
MAVKVKLHWVPYDVPNGQVKKELERYGKVSEITRDLFREKGFEAVESNARSVRLTHKEGYTVDSLPHEIRLEGCKVLVVVPGRAPLCLRCRRTGHIRRDCRVPRCSDCHRFGHEADDCVTTFALMARDRKVDNQLDFVMDDAEAEEAVGASGQTVLPPSDGGGSATPADVDHPATPAGRSSSEPVPQGARATGAKTEEPQAQEQDHSQSDGSAPRESDDDTPSRDPSASVPDADVEMGQVIKRLRDPTSTPEDAAAGLNRNASGGRDFCQLNSCLGKSLAYQPKTAAERTRKVGPPAKFVSKFSRENFELKVQGKGIAVASTLACWDFLCLSLVLCRRLRRMPASMSAVSGFSRLHQR